MQPGHGQASKRCACAVRLSVGRKALGLLMDAQLHSAIATLSG